MGSAGAAAFVAFALRTALRMPVVAALVGGSSLGVVAVCFGVASAVMAFTAAAASHVVAFGGAAVLAAIGAVCYSRAQETFENAFKEDAITEILANCPTALDEAIA